MKLYCRNDDIRWFAFSDRTGWVTFAAEVGGWRKREPVIGREPDGLREVPLRMGFNTGIPGAPVSGLFLVAKRTPVLHLFSTMKSRFKPGQQ